MFSRSLIVASEWKLIICIQRLEIHPEFSVVRSPAFVVARHDQYWISSYFYSLTVSRSLENAETFKHKVYKKVGGVVKSYISKALIITFTVNFFLYIHSMTFLWLPPQLPLLCHYTILSAGNDHWFSHDVKLLPLLLSQLSSLHFKAGHRSFLDL